MSDPIAPKLSVIAYPKVPVLPVTKMSDKKMTMPAQHDQVRRVQLQSLVHMDRRDVVDREVSLLTATGAAWLSRKCLIPELSPAP